MKKGLLGFFIAICGNALAQSELSYEVIGTQNGLSNNHIISIAEDKTGYLWVGTTSGLNRFNGHDSKIFRSDVNNPRSLYNDVITSLYVDSKNRVWIGHYREGIVSYDQSSGTFTRYPMPMTGGVAGILVEDSIVWLGVYQLGLCKLNLNTNRLQTFSLADHIHKDYSVHDKSNYNTVYAIEKDTTGVLWLGTADGLYSFDPKSETLKPHRLVPDKPGVFRGDYIVGMLLDQKRNAICIPTIGGFWIYDIASEKKEEFMFSQGQKPSIFQSVNGISWKSEDEIWLNSTDMGLISFNLNSKTFDLEVAKDVGLHPGILYRSTDYLWICTGQGLVKVKEASDLLTVHPIEGLPGLDITSIYADTILQKKFFAPEFSKYGLVVADWNEKKFKTFRCKTIKPDDFCEINNLFNIDDQYLLVLSTDFVQLFDKKKEIWVDLEVGANVNGISPEYSRALRDKRNNICITTLTNGVGFLDLKTSSFSWFKHDKSNPKSIASDQIRDMIEDP